MRYWMLTLALAAAGAAQAQSLPSAGEWNAYGRDAGGTRFSPLDQIDTTNVARLRLAWVYRTGDLLRSTGRFEATPLLLEGVLYLSTPLGRVSALDPASGAERWTYDPRVDLTRDYGDCDLAHERDVCELAGGRRGKQPHLHRLAGRNRDPHVNERHTGGHGGIGHRRLGRDGELLQPQPLRGRNRHV